MRSGLVLLVACGLMSAAALAGCGSDSTPSDAGSGGAGGAGDGGSGGTLGGTGGDAHWDEAASVQVALSAADQVELGRIEMQLAQLDDLTTSQLLASRAVTFETDLGYDPLSAAGLSLIQASSLALSQPALDKLATQGFVIVPEHKFPTMGYGYTTIYAEDLPVYVSLDAILDTVHVSYDAILKALESEVLIRELRSLLTQARTGLSEMPAGAVTTDLDLYFAVALSLLEGNVVAPVADANATTIGDLVELAVAAQGIRPVTLFGVQRDMDFSQFKPRGHYVADPFGGDDALERYFRAMIWMGRTDFRLIETLSSGEQVLRTRQLAAVIALRGLILGDARAAYDRIDAVVSAFVGEHDYMHLAQVDALMATLGVSDAAGLMALDPAMVAQAILDGGYGAQRIASQVIFKEPGAGAGSLPLDRSFALLGQRYVVDSHVFSNVVFDRVAPTSQGMRALPDPLDAAYAALGHAAALPLLESQLSTYEYASELESVRVLVDTLDTSFWDANLYNRWLSALRALSVGGAIDAELPAVARTEAWSRRLLNTQLASWAQLRHDTLLYAKQSYTTGAVCEFPDAYVDPYPEGFGALVRYAEHGQRLCDSLESAASGALLTRARAYFVELASVASILQEMAVQQRAGTPFNDAQMAFLNDAVRTQALGCAGPNSFTGWYSRLLFDNTDQEMIPTIADVHTDPNGPAVLHVATGAPRLMVVTVNTCTGPRAYAGVAFAYHEVVTGLNRLTDQDWAPMVWAAPDVPWMTPILP